MTESADWQTLPQGATLFGKLPQKRDFVRIHHDYPAALAFDEWLQESLADLAQHGREYGQLRLRFLFAQPQVSLVGVLAPSRDGAGRAFPVSVFAAVPSSAVREDAAAVWLASEPFFAAAEELVTAAGEGTIADVEARVRGLEVPGCAEWAAARGATGARGTHKDDVSCSSIALQCSQQEAAGTNAGKTYAVFLSDKTLLSASGVEYR